MYHPTWLIIMILFYLLSSFSFLIQGLTCGSFWPGTQYIEQVGLKLTGELKEICLSLPPRAGIKGMHHYVQLYYCCFRHRVAQVDIEYYLVSRTGRTGLCHHVLPGLVLLSFYNGS